MEMNYFKKTGKMMVAACMLAGLPFIPGTVSASELQTQMMSVQMESTTLKELFDLIEEKFNYTFLIRNNDINLNERISIGHVEPFGRGDFDDGAEKSAC